MTRPGVKGLFKIISASRRPFDSREILEKVYLNNGDRERIAHSGRNTKQIIDNGRLIIEWP